MNCHQQKLDNRYGRKDEDADFHNIVAWNKLAKFCAQPPKGGTYVEGRLRHVLDGPDGVKNSRTEVVISDMIILTKRWMREEIDQPAGEASAPEGS